MMKILFVYAVLSLLCFSMILAVDFIAGMNLHMEVLTMHEIFATTTLQEYLFMTVFLLLPFKKPLSNFLKKRNDTH